MDKRENLTYKEEKMFQETVRIFALWITSNVECYGLCIFVYIVVYFVKSSNTSFDVVYVTRFMINLQTLPFTNSTFYNINPLVVT